MLITLSIPIKNVSLLIELHLFLINIKPTDIAIYSHHRIHRFTKAL